jgi:integrase/recombinase XerD
MSFKKPTIKSVLDHRLMSETSQIPVKIRITYNRQPRLYSTGISLSKLEYAKINESSRLRDPYLRELRDTLEEIKQFALSICDELEPFDFKEFKRRFNKEEKEESNIETIKDLKEYYITYIEKFQSEGKISTSQGYNCSFESLKKFSNKLSFNKIDVNFLNKYEKWMLEQERSVTTISMYLRNLRTIFNMAIEDGVITRDIYPFGRRRYQIPAVRNIKKALTKEEILLIMKHPLELLSNKDKARDFWVLSYLCNGLNIKDLLNLKNGSKESGVLSVIRAKTRSTHKANSKPIQIPISNEISQILEKWRTPAIGDQEFMFNVLSKNDSPTDERRKVQNFTRFINKNMAKVCKEIGISKKVTTYNARHSFSTILRNNGVPIEYISEALGHSNIKTTQLYLDDFGNDAKKEFAKYLTLSDL